MGVRSAAEIGKSPQRTPGLARHRRSPGRRWRRVAASILIGALAALLIAGAALVALLHLKFEPVLSGSMRPGIQPGDLAVIRPLPAQDLKVGEVIAYLPPNHATPVMHRIVSLNADGIVTKGDANDVSDPWGRVKPQDSNVEQLVTVIPKVGFLTDIKRLLLIIAGALLVLVAVIAFWPSRRGKVEPEVDSNEAEDKKSHDGSIDDDRDVLDQLAMETQELTTKGKVTT